MNLPIRRVAYAVVALLLVLVGQLTYLQVVHADEYANDPRNARKILDEYSRPRGAILTADGQIVAVSTKVGDEFVYQRSYPQGDLFGQISGYQSVVYGTTGLEAEYEKVLTGKGPPARIRGLGDLGDLLVGRSDPSNLVLTVGRQEQQIARDALGDQKGSVVVLDPRDGSVVAMYSNPTYDPNLLASHNVKNVQMAYSLLNLATDQPLLPRAWAEVYPPGSTFKVVTTTAGLETGTVTPDSEFPVLRQLPLPQTNNTISNFGNASCGGTVFESFVHSCNTTFAAIGLALGNQFPPAMSRFGIGDRPPLDTTRPDPAPSTGPAPGSFDDNKPQFALAGIGQGPVSATPLQMALVAAAIANGGVVPTPHFGREVQDAKGETLQKIAPAPWRQATDATTAAEVRDMMVAVVARGTGRNAAIPGVTVAGKTGTAQVGDGGAPHAWFIAFAPAEAPRYAIAVFVDRGGRFGTEATGGQVAAPIAREVLMQLLAINR